MRPLTLSPRRFGWTDVRLPGGRSDVWAHPGVAVGPDGSVYLGGDDGRSFIRLVDDGEPVVTRMPTTECHGLVVDAAGDLWVADNGHKRRVIDGAYVDTETPGQVIRVTTDGRTAQRLPAPYEGWRPAGVALYASSHSDRILVADGYGASRVHCYTADGTILWSTDAADSGKAFSTPHGIAVDDRLASPRVAVADRRNRRIVMLDEDGTTSSVVGVDKLTSRRGSRCRASCSGSRSCSAASSPSTPTVTSSRVWASRSTSPVRAGRTTVTEMAHRCRHDDRFSDS
jgi:hypothetical protein